MVPFPMNFVIVVCTCACMKAGYCGTISNEFHNRCACMYNVYAGGIFSCVLVSMDNIH